MAEKFSVGRCDTEENLEGDSFEQVLKENRLVMFARPKTGSTEPPLECYDIDELAEWWQKGQSKLYYWQQGPITDKPVYKLMLSGIWIDDETAQLVLDKGYGMIQLKYKETHKIGSSFGVSQTHGAEEKIYSGDPLGERGKVKAKSSSGPAQVVPEGGPTQPEENLDVFDDITITKKIAKDKNMIKASGELNYSKLDKYLVRIGFYGDIIRLEGLGIKRLPRRQFERTLEVLDFGGNEIGSILEAINFLSDESTLTTLDLSGNPINSISREDAIKIHNREFENYPPAYIKVSGRWDDKKNLSIDYALCEPGLLMNYHEINSSEILETKMENGLRLDIYKHGMIWLYVGKDAIGSDIASLAAILAKMPSLNPAKIAGLVLAGFKKISNDLVAFQNLLVLTVDETIQELPAFLDSLKKLRHIEIERDILNKTVIQNNTTRFIFYTDASYGLKPEGYVGKEEESEDEESEEESEESEEEGEEEEEQEEEQEVLEIEEVVDYNPVFKLTSDIANQYQIIVNNKFSLDKLGKYLSDKNLKPKILIAKSLGIKEILPQKEMLDKDLKRLDFRGNEIKSIAGVINALNASSSFTEIDLSDNPIVGITREEAITIRRKAMDDDEDSSESGLPPLHIGVSNWDEKKNLSLDYAIDYFGNSLINHFSLVFWWGVETDKILGEKEKGMVLATYKGFTDILSLDLYGDVGVSISDLISSVPRLRSFGTSDSTKEDVTELCLNNFDSIPSEIAIFKNIVTLGLADCNVQKLPAFLDAFPKLRSINWSPSYGENPLNETTRFIKYMSGVYGLKP
jgi:Leucine-rich repeat (LRR) protein